VNNALSGCLVTLGAFVLACVVIGFGVKIVEATIGGDYGRWLLISAGFFISAVIVRGLRSS
jgi:hypothetical protein